MTTMAGENVNGATTMTTATMTMATSINGTATTTMKMATGDEHVTNFSGTLVMTLTDDDVTTKVPSITMNVVMVW